MDYFITRRGDYAVGELFQRDGGRYGRWNAIGLTTYAIGLLSQLPFLVTPLYNGPLAPALGYVDVAWIFGFLVSGTLYLLLFRRAERSGTAD